jgi:hypothetical protein
MSRRFLLGLALGCTALPASVATTVQCPTIPTLVTDTSACVAVPGCMVASCVSEGTPLSYHCVPSMGKSRGEIMEWWMML